MLAFLAAIAVVGAAAAPTVVNPRQAVVRVVGPNARCFATLYAPGWAVTTAACGSGASHLRTDDGSTHEVQHTTTDGRVTALGAPGAEADAYPPLGLWDFEAAWVQRRAQANMVGIENNAVVTLPLVAPPSAAPERPDAMLAVSPSAGCPLVDGAPLFADDPDGQGAKGERSPSTGKHPYSAGPVIRFRNAGRLILFLGEGKPSPRKASVGPTL